MKSTLVMCVVFAAFALGCDTKTEECNQMTSVINPFAEQLTALEKAFGAQSPDEIKAPLESAAKAAQETAGKLAALTLKKEELQKYATDYQAMCNEMAAAAKEMSTIMSEVAPMQKAAEESAVKSQEANTKLGTVCGSDTTLAEPCQKVMEALSGLPADPTQTEAATAKIAEIKALAMENEALKSAVGEVAAQLEVMVKSTADAMSVQKRLEEAAKKAEAATSKEDPIVDGLNTYCQAQ